MTPTMTRRSWLGWSGACLAATAIGGACDEALAAAWRADGPVEFLVPSGPGAALDMSARALGSILQSQHAVPAFVVTNRSGGAGAPVLQQLRQEQGNPRLLASLTASFLTGHASGVLPQNFSDFTPVAVLLEEYVAVAVGADVPVRNAQDLVQRLRKDPTSLSIAVASAVGNHIHIGIARPLARMGVDINRLTVVPFRSSAESLNALLGGHVDVVACTTPNVVAHVKAGRLRVIAVDAPERLGQSLAGVATWREQGIDVVGMSSQGVLAPQGISSEARAGWAQALQLATDTPQWQAFLETNQLRPRFLAGAAADSYLRHQYSELAGTLRRLGLTQG